MKLLLDENLSPRLVSRLADLGLFALHVAHIGKAGLSDAALFRYAFQHDMAVVTINAADFLTLAANVDLHPGLIVLRQSGLTADEQWTHLEPAVVAIMGETSDPPTLTNEVVEVTGAGRFRRYVLPAPSN